MSTSEEELLREYERQLASMNNSSPSVSPYQYSSSMFGNQQKQNLVEWELDFSQELVDIERLLRCDVLLRDKDGNVDWIPNPDSKRIFMNDLGVNDVLRKIRLLVNKNKVLSYYSIDEITIRVRTIQHELRVLIYNNYEQYGIDNEYKMNNYSSSVLAIGSIIEDAYRRALNGETHKGLADQRLVTQNEPLNNPNNINNMYFPQQQKQRSLFKPWTWF